MLYGSADFFWLLSKLFHEINNALDINGRFISRCLQHIGLMIKIAVLFAIDKWYAAGSIFAVLQRFDHSNATTMATQRTNGKLALIEHIV